MRQSDLKYAKDWRLRRWLTELKKGQAYNLRHRGGLSRLMDEHYEDDIRSIRAEIERRKLERSVAP